MPDRRSGIAKCKFVYRRATNKEIIRKASRWYQFLHQYIQIHVALLIERVFITNVKGTFLGMSESEEASKRR